MKKSSAKSYTEAAYDAEIARTQQSDWPYVGIRVTMLAIVFCLLARGIAIYGLRAGFLFLPLAAEFLTVFWVGLFLSYFVVDCPAFAKSSRKPILALGWTLATAAIICGVLAWDNGGFHVDQIGPGWAAGWQDMWSMGLVWALVAGVIGILFSTVSEVVRWRRTGGVFVWISVFHLGTRLTVVLLLGVPVLFLVFGFADSIGTWVFGTPEQTAWFVYGCLLVVEVGGLALGVLLHRSVVGKRASTNP